MVVHFCSPVGFEHPVCVTAYQGLHRRLELRVVDVLTAEYTESPESVVLLQAPVFPFSICLTFRWRKPVGYQQGFFPDILKEADFLQTESLVLLGENFNGVFFYIALHRALLNASDFFLPLPGGSQHVVYWGVCLPSKHFVRL